MNTIFILSTLIIAVLTAPIDENIEGYKLKDEKLDYLKTLPPASKNDAGDFNGYDNKLKEPYRVDIDGVISNENINNVKDTILNPNNFGSAPETPGILESNVGGITEGVSENLNEPKNVNTEYDLPDAATPDHDVNTVSNAEIVGEGSPRLDEVGAQITNPGDEEVEDVNITNVETEIPQDGNDMDVSAGVADPLTEAYGHISDSITENQPMDEGAIGEGLDDAVVNGDVDTYDEIPLEDNPIDHESEVNGLADQNSIVDNDEINNIEGVINVTSAITHQLDINNSNENDEIDNKENILNTDAQNEEMVEADGSNATAMNNVDESVHPKSPKEMEIYDEKPNGENIGIPKNPIEKNKTTETALNETNFVEEGKITNIPNAINSNEDENSPKSIVMSPQSILEHGGLGDAMHQFALDNDLVKTVTSDTIKSQSNSVVDVNNEVNIPQPAIIDEYKSKIDSDNTVVASEYPQQQTREPIDEELVKIFDVEEDIAGNMDGHQIETNGDVGDLENKIPDANNNFGAVDMTLSNKNEVELNALGVPSAVSTGPLTYGGREHSQILSQYGDNEEEIIQDDVSHDLNGHDKSPKYDYINPKFNKVIEKLGLHKYIETAKSKEWSDRPVEESEVEVENNWEVKNDQYEDDNFENSPQVKEDDKPLPGGQSYYSYNERNDLGNDNDPSDLFEQYDLNNAQKFAIGQEDLIPKENYSDQYANSEDGEEEEGTYYQQTDDQSSYDGTGVEDDEYDDEDEDEYEEEERKEIEKEEEVLEDYYEQKYVKEVVEEEHESSFFSFVLMSVVIVTAIALCIRSPAIFYSIWNACKTGRVVKMFPYFSTGPAKQGYRILPMGDKSV